MSQILSITEIQELLPQKYPFLMLDRVELSDDPSELNAIKNVTTNECQFLGHFPNNPIMPGVLQVEAMAQAGSILFNKMQHLGDKKVIIKAVQRTRFKSMIIPGDQVIINAKIDNVTPESCDVKASCKVNGKLNSQASFTLAVLNQADLTPKSLCSEFKCDVLEDSTEKHMDVNAIVFCDNDAEVARDVQVQAAENIKRVIARGGEDWSKNAAQNPYLIKDTQETKTTWHPIGS